MVLNTKNGGVEATWTPYLSNANAALYQVSYHPITFSIAYFLEKVNIP